MLPARTQNNHLTVEEVKELFEEWRKNRKHREPIPPLLWNTAVALTQHHSLYEVSNYLRLNYNDLKARMQKSSIVPPAFIELPVAASVECTIEIEKPTGERMRIKGNCNAVELAREFWGR